MKLAFIGTGKIIEDALYAVRFCPAVSKTAIYAREHSKAKAEKLAMDHQISEIYTDYNKLLTESSADTVYIGLVNSAHYQYAKEALNAGKNVILEKPLTGFYEQAKELCMLAKEKQQFLFEAITILHNPAFEALKSAIEKIGKIRLFNGNYSQYSSRYDSYRKGVVEHAFDPEYYGGALFDINIYNIHYCVALFGKPIGIDYFPNLGFNGIDTSGVLILDYDTFKAVCIGGKDADGRCYLSIQGEDGEIFVDSKPNDVNRIELSYTDSSKATTRDASGATVRAKKKEVLIHEEPKHRMIFEFEKFAKITTDKDFKLAEQLNEESLTVLEILETAREKAGINFLNRV
ncbi:Gfo/Idh/MocA family oxidoreductase [uncultured Succinivibrio sp.]|uniref:Gfo/Idh/MocA family protein n=1 Tax=uncultured Succinivibrio sp. TaxID=540749 RepID=UPI0025E4B7CB|nr:Gfo/Idh/MocA family oxidoreductase [uncultured Succinivibrio sp.]